MKFGKDETLVDFNKEWVKEHTEKEFLDEFGPMEHVFPAAREKGEEGKQGPAKAGEAEKRIGLLKDAYAKIVGGHAPTVAEKPAGPKKTITMPGETAPSQG